MGPPRAMRVLVTGAGGMIGSAVAARLNEDGLTVRALLGPGDSPDLLPDGVEYAFADVTERSQLPPVVKDMSAVVHLAGPPSVAASFDTPSTFARVHTVGTANLLEVCRDSTVARFCHVSSAEVYGAPDVNPVPESAPTLPGSPYGAAKLGAEMLVRSFGPAVGMEVVVLRPFSVYGAQPPPWSLLGTIMRQALRAPEIRLAALSPVRDYVHVDDVASAVASALSARLVDPLVVNVGSGTGWSVEDVAHLVLDAVGRRVPIVEIDSGGQHRMGRDVVELVADIREAHLRLDWQPATSLREGLTRLLHNVALD